MDLRSFATAQSPEDQRWQPYFFIALATLATSFVLAFALVAAAACGSGGSSPAPAGTIEPAPTAAPSTPTAVPSQVAPTATASIEAPRTVTAPPPATPDEDRSTVVGCGLLAPVDQTHRVARDCVAGGLTNVEGFSLVVEAASAYQRMAADASKDGITIFIISGYRTFETQAELYRSEVAQFGPNQNTSAKPGHSEHQLGTTVDLNELSGGFGSSPAGRWLAQNSTKYGFVLSYPAGREAQTGYAYEPWHFRYVGPGTASAYAGSGATLNRFLGGGQ